MGDMIKKLEIEPERERVRRGPRKYVTPGIQSQPGSDNGGSILTEDDVIMIRKLWDHGIMGTKLARIFGVKPSTIYAITSQRSWRHIL